MEYTILDFSPTRATITVAFEDRIANPVPLAVLYGGLTALPPQTVLNHNAPRKNGVYLEGAEFDDYICMLAGEPLSGALTQEELDQMILETATDDPATITGGGYIMDKYVEYLEAQGTPLEVIQQLMKI